MIRHSWHGLGKQVCIAMHKGTCSSWAFDIQRKASRICFEQVYVNSRQPGKTSPGDYGDAISRKVCIFRRPSLDSDVRLCAVKTWQPWPSHWAPRPNCTEPHESPSVDSTLLHTFQLPTVQWEATSQGNVTNKKTCHKIMPKTWSPDFAKLLLPEPWRST